MTQNVAIAGFSGYIGTHITQAALDLGLQVYGIDPFLNESFKNHDRFQKVKSIDAFCNLRTDCFYLALQPNHRGPYLNRLIKDGRLILSETPMARARDPEKCDALVNALTGSGATIYYNFLFLYNPVTYYTIEFLRKHPTAKIAI